MMMKLMIATALVTATLVGTFMESAQAESRGQGEEATGSRYNALELNYTFKLYETTPTGEPRKDEDGDYDNNMGIFTGAVEEFKGKIREASTDQSDDVFSQLNTNFKLINISNNLNLTARLIFAGSKILLPNTTVAIDTNQQKLVSNYNRIEYILTGGGLESKGLIELALIIDNLSVIDGLSTIDAQRKAVNSIEYIIDRQLLGKVNKIRVSGKSSKPELGIVSNEATVPTHDNIDGFPPPKVKKIPDRVVQVPESNSINSVLNLGVLGVGLLLKRKIK